MKYVICEDFAAPFESFTLADTLMNTEENPTIFHNEIPLIYTDSADKHLISDIIIL